MYDNRSTRANIAIRNLNMRLRVNFPVQVVALSKLFELVIYSQLYHYNFMNGTISYSASLHG